MFILEADAPRQTNESNLKDVLDLLIRDAWLQRLLTLPISGIRIPDSIVKSDIITY